ncbi:hypothetical protein D3C84_998650 [compost metagenome]
MLQRLGAFRALIRRDRAADSFGVGGDDVPAFLPGCGLDVVQLRFYAQARSLLPVSRYANISDYVHGNTLWNGVYLSYVITLHICPT